MWHAYSIKHAQRHQQKQYWKDYRQICKLKRQDNFNKSIKILNDLNVPYTIDSDKCCLIQHQNQTIYFYPTTGTFQGSVNGRGIQDLLEKLF